MRSNFVKKFVPSNVVAESARKNLVSLVPHINKESIAGLKGSCDQLRIDFSQVSVEAVQVLANAGLTTPLAI
jgi:hypothetical protein